MRPDVLERPDEPMTERRRQPTGYLALVMAGDEQNPFRAQRDDLGGHPVDRTDPEDHSTGQSLVGELVERHVSAGTRAGCRRRR